MFAFQRTNDYELVRGIITHPRVYPHVSDDFSPAPDLYEPADHPALWYVLVREGGELLGMWMFAPQNFICWEVHMCMLPNGWGERGLEAARALEQWMWENTPCQRIVASIPIQNSLAVRFALKAGMEPFGLNPKSYQKGGVLQDQVLLGASRPGA